MDRPLTSASLPWRSRWGDRLFTAVAWLLGAVGFALPLVIVGYLAVHGSAVVSWEFLSSAPSGLPLGTGGGIWPAIQGSLALAGIGTAVAFPLSLGGGIFLAEYSRPGPFRDACRFAADCLAGVPGLIYGLFGYAALVVFLSLNVSLLAGGIVLGLIMAPIMLIGTQEALSAIDPQIREAALSLGVTRAYATRRVLLRMAWPGVLAATVLAAGHAIGSAAPVLFTATTIFSRQGLDLSLPVMSLPTHLYYLTSEAVSFEHAYGTALVLIGVLLATNVAVMILKRALAPK